MVALSSTAEALAAVSSAREVDVLAYTLRRGPVLDGLEAAARHGAHVRVRLEGAPYNDSQGALARENRRIAGELASFGVDARLAHVTPDQAPLHAKALVADGRLFLDDRNWRSDDFVVCDRDETDVASIRDVVDGATGATNGSSLAIHKRDALASEAELLRSARRDGNVVVESESFGYGNPVYAALDALGRAGAAPRLLVNAREAAGNSRERSALQRLANDGVAVRASRDSEKFALVGERAWIGSANASPAFGQPDTIDWGLRTDDRVTVAAARQRVEARWSAARPLKPYIANRLPALRSVTATISSTPASSTLASLAATCGK